MEEKEIVVGDGGRGRHARVWEAGEGALVCRRARSSHLAPHSLSFLLCCSSLSLFLSLIALVLNRTL